MRRSSHVASMSTGPSPEYGTKIFTGDVATKVGCRAAGVDTRAAPFRSSSCVPLLLRYICPPMGRPACVRWSNAEYVVVLIEQFLSKYGESAALLKDPSWTKDPQKADKGKSLKCPGVRSAADSRTCYVLSVFSMLTVVGRYVTLNVLVCGPPLTVGRATCYPCSPCSLSLDAMSPLLTPLPLCAMKIC
jgi:hypothetical protein